MNLATFYAFMAATCMTLVGLWWNVVDRRPDLIRTVAGRRRATGVYLSFLLPAVMGLFAQVAPDRGSVWRTTFVAVSVVGMASTWSLIRSDRQVAAPGTLARHRWIVAALYGLIALFGAVPRVATELGLAAIQAAAIALIGLIIMAHALTWEFLTEHPTETESAPASAPDPGR